MEKKVNNNRQQQNSVERQWLNVVEDTEFQLFEFHTTKCDRFAHTVPHRYVHVCRFCGNLLTFSIWLQICTAHEFSKVFFFWANEYECRLLTLCFVVSFDVVFLLRK